MALVTVTAVLVGASSAGAPAAQQSATPATFKQVGRWGTSGPGQGQFVNALGLATDATGNVYVADTDNNRVQVFSPSGAFVREWGSQGFDEAGKFSGAQDVAIDPDGSVWVADRANQRVQHFSSTGVFQAAYPTPKQATGIAVDATGQVYASAHGDETHTVVRFDRANPNPVDTLFGGLDTPWDIEVSRDGSIYVADNGLLQVNRYEPGGKLLGTIKGGVSSPVALGVDLDCNLWLGNIAERRIEKYSPQGKLLTTAASTDLIAEDIAIGPTGDLYVNDHGSGIVHFAENRSRPTTAAVPARLTVATGPVVRVRYTLTGIACPSVVGATAALKGTGILGVAQGLKLKAGKTAVIPIRLSRSALKKARPSGKATFKIVLKTNGRQTTQSRVVTVVVPDSVR